MIVLCLIALVIYVAVGLTAGKLATKTIAAASTWSDKELTVWVHDETNEVRRTEPKDKYGYRDHDYTSKTIKDEVSFHRDYFRSKMFWLRFAWPITLLMLFCESSDDKAIAKYDPVVAKTRELNAWIRVAELEKELEIGDHK